VTVRPVTVLALLPLLAAGCGGAAAPSSPRNAVRLTLDTPGDLDTVREGSVQVSGSVQPSSATVLVRGRRVPVLAGRFSTEVGLDAGTNVIDVLAGARGARDAMTALRVRRQITVRVPDLTGESARQAKARLAGLGLRGEEVDASGPFDALLPGDPKVCQTDPEADTDVDAGKSVKLYIAKNC
jgi:hypothetical protein